MTGPKPRPVADRFWPKVNKTEDCWLWTGAKWSRGYGSMLGASGKVEGAHVIAYKLLVGRIPTGMKVDHRCHVKLCVNPAHLRLATTKQNAENLRGARVHSKTGILGVSWDKKSNKWRAQLSHNGECVIVGRFTYIEEAEAAVKAKRNELFTHNDKDR